MTKEKIDKAIEFWQNDDEKQAIKLLELIDLEKNAEANTLIGQMYIGAERGVSNIKKNVKKGIQFLQKGLILGDAEAGIELANLYYLGEGVKENHKKAEKYWIASWGLGEERAGFELANFYYDEHNEKINEAINIYEKLISKSEFVGDCNSKLSKIYEKGIGKITPDPARSLSYLEAGTKDSHLYCCMTLGLKYYRGDGVEKDISKAIELVERVKDNDLFEQEVRTLLDKMIKNEKI